jgi:hypothetical protein
MSAVAIMPGSLEKSSGKAESKNADGRIRRPSQEVGIH